MGAGHPSTVCPILSLYISTVTRKKKEKQKKVWNTFLVYVSQQQWIITPPPVFQPTLL